MARSRGLDTLLRDPTDRAVAEVPGAASRSITVRRAGRPMTPAGGSWLPGGLDLDARRPGPSRSGPPTR
ncbi:hypothetical protein [Streptomyces tagetis]|uniref:hypothetical protein n=1 Tax=Streptomyces tagetis TaxID=2820809 RepID=UPI001FF97711|nr:hypothetical protein [Streptomyces sp. RG38]